MQNVKPLGKRLVVKLPPHITKGSILLPESAQTVDDRYIVVSVGADVVDIKPGDHVLINPSTTLPMELDFEGEKHFLLHEDHLLGII